MPVPQLLQFAFAAGINEDQRAEVLDPTAGFLTLENVRQTKTGALTKRDGFTTLTTTRLDGTTRTTGYKLFSLDKQLCVVDGHNIDTYSSQATRFVTRDKVPECTTTRIPLQYPGASPSALDALYVNGYILVAAATTDAALNVIITVSVIDSTTYALLRIDKFESLPAANTVRLSAVSTTAVLVYSNAANTITGRTMTMTASGINTGWSGTSTLYTDQNSGMALDTHTLEDRFAIAYANTSAGTDRLSVRTFNASLTGLENTAINSASSAPLGVSMAGTNADVLWVAWTHAPVNSARLIGLQGNSLATVLGTAANIVTGTVGVRNVGVVVTGTQAGRLFASTNDSTYSEFLSRSFNITAGAVTTVGSTDTRWREAIVSKPFRVDSRDYAVLAHQDAAAQETNSQKIVTLVDLTASDATFRPVAVPAAYYALHSGGGFTAHTVNISSTKIGFVMATQTQGYVGYDTGAAIELALFDFGDVRRWQPARFKSGVYMTGGVTTFFDGQIVREAGFIVRPDKPTVSLGGTGYTDTNVRYIAIYEQSDAAGNVERSNISDVSNNVATVTNQTATVTLSNLFMTTRHDTASTVGRVRIALYRMGDTSGAGVYYRVGSAESVTSASTTTFADNVSETTLSTQQKLYRQVNTSNSGNLGTELQHQAPPASLYSCVYNDMLVLVSDAGDTIWYSADPITGEGPWWNANFQIPITDAGAITGLAAQDGNLYIFKRNAVFVINGVTPSANGSAGGFGDARRLAVDVGCIDSRSIVVTAKGTFFQSERGIEILTRAQTVEFIGEAVQTTTTDHPVCTSAVLDAANNVVIFTLAASESANQVSGNGPRLVFDLTLGAWVSVDKVPSNEAAQSAAIIYTGTAYRYAWLGTNGIVNHVNPGNHQDSSTWVTMKVETGWIKTGGLQGYQQIDRVLLFAKEETDHNLAVSLAYDYSSTYKTARTYTRAEIDTLVAAIGNEQLEVLTHDEAKCQAIRVKIEDATPTGGTVGTGKGPTLIGLSFEGSPDAGRFRLPDASR